MTNVLIVPEKNEKLKPLNVVERGLMSKNIDQVYVVDGWSTDGTEMMLKQPLHELEKKYKKKVKLIFSELRNTGKGGAMVTGIKKALAEKHSKILFLDADITSVTPEWCDLLVKRIDKVDMARGYFNRAAFDAQITKHITRPLISMFFPEGKDVNQPLGGELCMTAKLGKYLINHDIAPTHTWGIDTFFTITTLVGGYKIREVYLGQKAHTKKSTAALRPMAIECFDEAAKQIYYHKRNITIPKFKESLVKVLPKTDIKPVGADVRKIKYTNPDIEIETFLNHLNSLRANGVITATRINNVPISKFEDAPLFLNIIRSKNVEEFKEKSKNLGTNEWIRILDVLLRKYIHFNFASRYYELVYILWKMRALSFMLNEAKTFEEAEKNTALQAKCAFEFAQRGKCAL